MKGLLEPEDKDKIKITKETNRNNNSCVSCLLSELVLTHARVADLVARVPVEPMLSPAQLYLTLVS